jgi:cell division protein FtsB
MRVERRTWTIIGCIILFLVLFANSGFRALVRRYWEMHTLRLEYAQLKKENTLLQREVYFLERDPAYIERIARKELGLIAPGEVEYRFKNK